MKRAAARRRAKLDRRLRATVPTWLASRNTPNLEMPHSPSSPARAIVSSSPAPQKGPTQWPQATALAGWWRTIW
jgi:hypothetical protein